MLQWRRENDRNYAGRTHSCQPGRQHGRLDSAMLISLCQPRFVDKQDVARKDWRCVRAS